MPFAFKDIYHLIESLPENGDITLIGGQALNFWTELYFHDDPEFYREYGPFTSKDIDFQGKKDSVVKCAEIWGGVAKLSDPFDVSPNSGIVIVPLESGEKLVIDFLSSVYGLNDADILKHRIRIRYKNADFYVMHPLHCLKSRIANVIGLHRDDAVSLTRIDISISVMKKRIEGLIDKNQKRRAFNEIESVFHIARDSGLGGRMFWDYNLDVFDAVPKDRRLGAMFVSRRYPQMQNILRAKRYRQEV